MKRSCVKIKQQKLDFTLAYFNVVVMYLYFLMRLTALAEMVACLPLVQRVRGSNPGGVVNFHLENFEPWGYEGWRCTFSNRQIVHHRPGLNSKPFRSMYVEKAYTIVLLIAIRPSDGDVKPGGLLGAIREEQAMSRHRVSPSPFLSSSSYTT